MLAIMTIIRKMTIIVKQTVSEPDENNESLGHKLLSRTCGIGAILVRHVHLRGDHN